jgi:hypothetical protein
MTQSQPPDPVTAKWLEIIDNWKKIAADGVSVAVMEAANRANVVAQKTAAVIGKLTMRQHELEIEIKILKAELRMAAETHASEMRQAAALRASEIRQATAAAAEVNRGN